MAGWEDAKGRLGKAAEWYANNNWHIHPVHGIDSAGMCTCGRTHKESKENAKHPASTNGQKDATTDTVVINSWWEENPEFNIGVYAKPSGFFVIDIDPRNNGDESIVKLEERAEGNLPPTVEAITGEYYTKKGLQRGRHLYYKCDPNEKFLGNFKSQGLDGIDIKHNGYVLVTPSRHASGHCYEWKAGHAPWEMEMAEAPEELLNIIRARTLKRSSSGTSGNFYSSSDWEFLRDLNFGPSGDKLDVDKILEEGIDEGGRALGLYALACALANKFGTDIAGRTSVEAMMLKFNAEMVRPPMEVEGSNGILMHTRNALDFVANNPIWSKWWDGLKDYVPENGEDWAKTVSANFISSPSPSSSFNYSSEISASSIHESEVETGNTVGNQVAALAATGRSLRDITSGGNLDLPKDVDALSSESGGRPGSRSLSDIGNGRRLIDAFGSSVRFTPQVGWFVWNGTYWKPDTSMNQVKELSKHVSTIIAREAATLKSLDDPRGPEIVKWANSAKSNARINAMIEQATSDPRIDMDITDWDKNPYLLGVKNGVVDLKTGQLNPGDIEAHITRISPISYTQGLTNVRWTTFLNEAFGGDKELIEWAQKAVGYTATGLNNQDVVFLIYGPPGSGKNTFIETIFEALGAAQHAWALDSNVLALGDRVSASDEYHMAELRGRRMIWVDELPESERIKENQVKKLTGSGTIQGRSPGEKPIQFTSTGKLWISTNHRPIITDEAMWRRILPMPLTNKPAKPDPSLKKYLADPEGALPAVLAWIVEGAVKYLSSSDVNPLAMCTAVRDAHEVYRKNEDRIGSFLDEETILGEDLSVNVNALYRRYKAWSDSRGERPVTQIAYHRKLIDRGLDVIGNGNRAVLKGVGLAPYEVQDVQQTDFASLARFSF